MRPAVRNVELYVPAIAGNEQKAALSSEFAQAKLGSACQNSKVVLLFPAAPPTCVPIDFRRIT
jgi:hypothetical protein